MCIRDRVINDADVAPDVVVIGRTIVVREQGTEMEEEYTIVCLLYTSDAADERSSVDLGGRRIIKKKTRTQRDTCSQS